MYSEVNKKESKKNFSSVRNVDNLELQRELRTVNVFPFLLKRNCIFKIQMFGIKLFLRKYKRILFIDN